MTTPRVLLLHGVEHHREPDHWLWWLAEELRRARIPVQYPQLPAADAPSLDEWRSVALAELAMLGDGPRIVVAHSLGTTLWGHLAADLPRALAPDRVLLVGPPAPQVWWDAIESFAYEPAAMGAALPRGGDETLVIGRETDPYRPGPLAALTAGWAARAHELPGEGHLNADDGHGPWPWALDWVLGNEAEPAP